jgi:hypothetical protein
VTRVYADGAALQAELEAFLTRFLASEAAVEAARPIVGLEELDVLELRITDPDARVWIDFPERRLLTDRPPAPAKTVATIEADALHHLLLDHLGPVEISRLAEEGRIDLEGPPLALAALLAAAGGIQPHYRASLEERGRDDLLAVPPPPVGDIWESTSPPPLMFGVTRPWQRDRAATSPA